MNKLIVIAAVSVASAVATCAWADDITPDNSATQAFTVTKTRAQVQAELSQARADGSLAALSSELMLQRPMLASVTREEVKAAMRVNRDAGFAAAAAGEDSGSFYLSQVSQPGAAQSWMARNARAGH